MQSWNRRVAFSWHKPEEMNDRSKFRILPVFFERTRKGSRQDYALDKNGFATRIGSRQNINATIPLVNYFWLLLTHFQFIFVSFEIICSFYLKIFRIYAKCLVARPSLEATLTTYKEKTLKSIFLLTFIQLEINHVKNVKWWTKSQVFKSIHSMYT